MPISGAPSGSFAGLAEDVLVQCDIVAVDGATVRATVKTMEGAEGWYCIVVDHRVGEFKKVYSDSSTIFYGTLQPRGTNDHIVSIVPMGDLSGVTNGIDPRIQQYEFESYLGKYKEVTITPSLQFDVIENASVDSQLTNWNLTGICRYWTGNVNQQFNTRLEIKLDLYWSNDNYYLRLYDETNETLATGSTNSPTGTITLTAANENVSGTVDLAWEHEIDGGVLLVRYPNSFKLYVDDVYYNSTTMDAIANDTIANIGPFEVGQHELAVKQVSDTGEESAAQTATFTIYGAPRSIGNLAVVAGGTYAATQITYTPSPDTTTVKVYDSELNQPVNFNTAIDDTTNTTITLPAITLGAGIRRVCVEPYTMAETTELPSGYRITVDIEYDSAGNVVMQRPNAPNFSLSSLSTDRLLTINYSYYRHDEKGIGDKVRLYVINSNPELFDSWNNHVATKTLPSYSMIPTSSLTYQVPAEGNYYYLVKAVTSSGVVSDNVDWQGPIFLSSDIPAAPSISFTGV